MITLASQGSGTKYTATVIHADEAGCKKHAAMGFKEGWGKALDQLVALAVRGSVFPEQVSFSGIHTKLAP